jgi:sirohydrochlorin ferrochelatase
MRVLLAGVVVACLLAVPRAEGGSALQPAPMTGVLLLAHGGQPLWNDTVTAIAREVDRTYPTEVAFGMASKPAIAAALDRLAARGATRVRAVPLFVSSHSSVITSTQYLLGLRDEAPADLATFAKMRHAHGGRDADPHADHTPPDLAPIALPMPVTMASALDDSAVVGQILADRARGLSSNPAREVVLLVAHGPVPEDDNARWLSVMKSLADQMAPVTTFARIEYQTVRDDAPEPIRGQATEELRQRVERAAGEGLKVLIVPLLLSNGGIEKGIRKRLEGLDYGMSPALAPDPRLALWVLAQIDRS